MRGAQHSTREIEVTCDSSDRVLLVLDASESARKYRENVVNAANEVLRQLSGNQSCEIAFLGSPVRYAARDFKQQGHDWFRAHESRASLLGPVVRGQGDQSSWIGVIGSGPIFDLRDWSDEQHSERLVLLSLGAPLHDSNQTPPLLAHSAVELAGLLDPAPTAIELTGPGFVPVDWDGDGELQVRDGELTLRIADFADSIRVRFLGGSDSQVTVRGVNRSGQRVELQLAITDRGPLNGRPVALTSSEAIVLERVLHGEPFTCPHCGIRHAASATRCDRDDHPKYRFVGRPLFETLEGISDTQWIVCDVAGERITLQAFSQKVFVVSDTDLWVRTPERSLNRVERSVNGTWSESRADRTSYFSLGGGRYVLDLS